MQPKKSAKDCRDCPLVVNRAWGARREEISSAALRRSRSLRAGTLVCGG